MIKWIKTNGNEIETNSEKATIKYCESLGWERDEDGLNIDKMNKLQLAELVAELGIESDVDMSGKIADVRAAVADALEATGE